MNYNISRFIPYYPAIKDDDFNSTLSGKHEFRDPKVGTFETFPRPRGDLMAHQIIISRIMSSYTPYNGILLLHDMGTGKTCSAAAIIEQIRSENTKLNRYIYVSSSTDLGNNFEAEFKNVCTSGEYDDVKLERKGITKLTYTSFIKRYGKGGPVLENTVVIIDEIHNQRRNAATLRKIIQAGKNIKTILLSGTPMTDSPSGIADIMNIIIPDDADLLPTDEDFYSNLDETRIAVLRRAFKGRISYIKSMPVDNVKRTYIGGKYNFKHYTVDASVMSDHQYKVYKTALETDMNDASSAAYSNSRLASNFVGPDGKYRKDEITPAYDLSIRGNSNEDKLEILSRYSKKYADSVRMILDPANADKTIFVFNTSVNGGGLNMFAKILRQFGFGSVGEKGSRTANDNLSSKLDRMAPASRYILLTGEGGVDKASLVNRFNRDDNKNGAFIKVVLASDAISEGYTFKNIQIVDIHSPWFQFAKISQAIARGIRFGSHRALLEDGGDVNVNIHLRVSVPPDGKMDGQTERGIDMYTYKTAEDKDIIVKNIEHIIKEESIDSIINKERNKRPKSLDGSRDCDYMDCDYTPFPTETMRQKDGRDYSTYQSYYNDQSGLISAIIDLFRDRLVINFNDIVSETKDDMILVTSALYEIITSNKIIRDDMYLREQNNIYFLTKNRSNTSSVFDVYYIQNPISEILVDDEMDKIDVKISEILKDPSIEDVQGLITKLIQYGFTASDKEKLIESFVTKHVVTKQPTQQSIQVEKLFDGLFGNIDGVYYSWYPIQDCLTVCRKMEGDMWMDCSEDDENRIIEYIKQVERDVTDTARDINNDGTSVIYYGLSSFDETKIKDNVKFKILRKDLSAVITDKRVKPSGQVCTTFLKSKEIYTDIVRKIGLDENDQIYIEIAKLLSAVKLPKKKLGCMKIEEALRSKNLIIRDVSVKRPLCPP